MDDVQRLDDPGGALRLRHPAPFCRDPTYSLMWAEAVLNTIRCGWFIDTTCSSGSPSSSITVLQYLSTLMPGAMPSKAASCPSTRLTPISLLPWLGCKP